MRTPCVAALILIALLPVPVTAQPAAPPDSAYADYALLLSRYVRGGGVDYAGWKADDPPAWRRFRDWLENVDPGAWPLAERRAFWINAYNARVIAGVLERYPLDSVRDVGLLGGRCEASSRGASIRWPGRSAAWTRWRRRSCSGTPCGTPGSTGA